jgi:hypothetical protein
MPATQILFVQGAGKDVHETWDNKLVDSLRRALGPGYEIVYPIMPAEADPEFATWRATLETEIARLHDGAIVVGHSIGGTILINVLAEWHPPIMLGAIVLIAAPFIGNGGWPSDDIEPRSDLAERLPAGVPVFLYHGDEDDIAPVAHVALYTDAIPRAHVRRLPNRDHQLGNDLAEVASDIRELASRSGGSRQRHEGTETA